MRNNQKENEMKNNWQKVKLNDLVGKQGIFSDGDWVESKDQDLDGDIRLIQLADIGDGEFKDKSERFMNESKFEKLNCTALKTGDILIARMPDPLGRSCLFPGLKNKAATVVDVAILRVDDELADNRFVMYMINNTKFRNTINNLSTGTTRKRISRKNLSTLEIPLPPLLIQKKIAEALDTADEIRRKRQQTIDKLDELVQSVFLDMFGDPVNNEKGWEDDKLGLICNVRSSKRIFKNELVKEGIPFYRGQEIKELADGNNINNNLFISNKRYDEILAEDNIPKIGDLLLPSITPDGEIWVVDTKSPFYFKDGRVLWIENDNSKLESYYLKYFLKSLFKSNYQKIASGTTFKELKIFILQDIDVLIPPTNLQVKFRNILKSLKTNRIKYNKISDEENILAKALMQKAFRGELEFA